MKKAKITGGFVALLVAVFCFLPAMGGATTTHVDCGASDTTNILQTAINAANSGDTLEVEGTCTENVTVGKQNLTLDGSYGGTSPVASIIAPKTSSPAVKVTAPRGFHSEFCLHSRRIIWNSGDQFRFYDNY